MKKSIFSLLLVVLVCFASVAVADAPVQAGYFSFVLPDRLEPDENNTFYSSNFSSDRFLLTISNIQMDENAEIPIPKTVDELNDLVEYAYGESIITLDDMLLYNVIDPSRGVVSTLRRIHMLIANQSYDGVLLAAAHNEQVLIAALLDYHLDPQDDELLTQMLNFTSSFRINDTMVFDEQKPYLDYPDAWADGEYYLSQGPVYLKVSEDDFVVLSRNPPENASIYQLGFSLQEVRDRLTQQSSDIIVYPLQYISEDFYIKIQIKDQDNPGMGTLKKLHLMMDEKLRQMDTYEAKNGLFLLQIMSDNMRYYSTVQNGDTINIYAYSSAGLDEERIQLIEDVLNNLRFE